MTARVLVLGGTGSFGRRLVERLVATTDATVIVAGRSAHAFGPLAAELVARHPGRALGWARLDRSAADAEAIAALDPAVVIDAAGPFQGADLSFARAVIMAGRSYVDIADARDFVAAFASLGAEARAAGVVAIAGASSTPALSHAALDTLTAGWRRVDRVEIAISPGNRAPRGLSVVTAILSYAGRPVRVLEDGRWRDAPGWGLIARRRLPGVGPRWLSLCETPDLDLVPARFPGVRTALFRAGLELAPLHLGLWAASLMVRAGVLRDLPRYAKPLRAIAAAFERFGGDHGGMLVETEGIDADGAPQRARWSLVAEAGDGPNVPILPALAFTRALIDGRPPAPPGAHVAAGLMTLDAFETEAAPFAIRTATARGAPAAASVFERALGPDVRALPAAVRRAHAPDPATELLGTVDVDGPSGMLGRLVAKLFGFPPAQLGAEARVTIERSGAGEVWTRRFGGSTFRSRVDAGAEPGMLVERFGPFAFDLAIAADASGFSLSVEGWRALGVPLPWRLVPRTQARGFATPDRGYGFDVAIALPVAGRLVRYRGQASAAVSQGPVAEERTAGDEASPAVVHGDQRPQ